MKLFAIVVAAVAAHAATPTFNKDIAPILYQNCATCHRPGEVAPFSLLTYAEAAKKAGLLATVTQKRVMPPWKAEPGFGSFANERRLSEPKIALIRDWAKAGAPEGDPKDKPAAPAFPSGRRGSASVWAGTAARTAPVSPAGAEIFAIAVI